MLWVVVFIVPIVSFCIGILLDTQPRQYQLKGLGLFLTQLALLLWSLYGLRLRVVGLTGGIATGKSTVSTILGSTNDFVIVDADLIAREVVKPGRKAYNNLVKAFGEEILQEDKTLDRAALREIVFKDPSKRQALNRATHQPILTEMIWSAFRARFSSLLNPPVVVLDAPLLFETKLHFLCKVVVVVYTSREVQVERLLQRDQKSREDAENIISAQMSIAEKAKLGDLVIDNSGPLSELREKVDGVITQMRSFG